MQDEITDGFSRLDRFERLASLGMASMHPGGLAASLELASWAELRPGARVLDVGCGVGQTACLLATRFGAQVTGVDLSDRMIARARARAARAGVKITFHTGDAKALPFAEGSFDVVLAESVTLFLDKPPVLAEFLRVLVPGGLACDIVMTCQEPVPEAILAEFERLEGVRMRLISPAEWLSSYRDSGFELSRSRFEPRISDRATFWSFFSDNGPAGLLAIGRMVAWYLADATFRSYLRDITSLWNREQSRFGYGLLMCCKPATKQGSA